MKKSEILGEYDLYLEKCEKVEKFMPERTLYNGEFNPYWKYIEERNEVLERSLRNLGYVSLIPIRPHKENVTYENTVLEATLREMGII